MKGIFIFRIVFSLIAFKSRVVAKVPKKQERKEGIQGMTDKRDKLYHIF